MTTTTKFLPWPKIMRTDTGAVHATITEKIDGTNACVIIENGELVACQSRNRLIRPGDDNLGFAFWAWEHKSDLAALLGDGYHYGEWAGPGIQKNPLDLPFKQFFLFNTHRWTDVKFDLYTLRTVPVLYQGAYSAGVLQSVVANLHASRSYKPEGIIIYLHEPRTYLKWTYEGAKWKQDQAA